MAGWGKREDDGISGCRCVSFGLAVTLLLSHHHQHRPPTHPPPPAKQEKKTVGGNSSKKRYCIHFFNVPYICETFSSQSICVLSLWFGVYHYLPTPPQPSLCLPLSAPPSPSSPIPSLHFMLFLPPPPLRLITPLIVFFCPLLSGQLWTFGVHWDYTCIDFFFLPLLPRRAATPPPLVHTCQLQLRHGQSSSILLTGISVFILCHPCTPHPHPPFSHPPPLCSLSHLSPLPPSPTPSSLCILDHFLSFQVSGPVEADDPSPGGAGPPHCLRSVSLSLCSRYAHSPHPVRVGGRGRGAG